MNMAYVQPFKYIQVKYQRHLMSLSLTFMYCQTTLNLTIGRMNWTPVLIKICLPFLDNNVWHSWRGSKWFGYVMAISNVSKIENNSRTREILASVSKPSFNKLSHTDLSSVMTCMNWQYCNLFSITSYKYTLSKYIHP